MGLTLIKLDEKPVWASFSTTGFVMSVVENLEAAPGWNNYSSGKGQYWWKPCFDGIQIVGGVEGNGFFQNITRRRWLDKSVKEIES